MNAPRSPNGKWSEQAMSVWILIAIFVSTLVGLVVLFVFFVGVFAIIDALATLRGSHSSNAKKKAPTGNW